MLGKVMNNIFYYSLDNGDILREVMVKIELERIDTQEEVMVEVFLDSSVMWLVMSLKFSRKQGFKLKKIKKPIYMRNINGSFNKERPIKYTVEVNIYYQGHKKRTEINVIGDQKWSVILGMLWLVYYNSEIDWRTEEVKMMRYPEKYGKQ